MRQRVIDTPRKIQCVAGAAHGEKEGALYIACVLADGNLVVPNVNANADGDFKFNLDNWDGDWNADNCLVCFCYSFDFSHYLLVGVFS